MFTSNALDSLAFKMTSLLASSRATPWLGSFRSYAWSMSGACVSRANRKSALKYTAVMRLSAARPAATRLGGMLRMPATAT